jgi:YVTN family beta-propeller protein
VPRNRVVVGAILAVVIVVGAVVVITHQHGSDVATARVTAGSTPTTKRAPTTTAAPTTTTTTLAPHDPALDFTLSPVTTINGAISPKSVTATGTGLVFAQNMMYRHTLTVYNADSGSLVKTIPDSVDLSQFGISGHPGISRGAPVEAAVDHAHKYLFTSNYSMYGANFGPEGSDNCGGPGGLSPSYVYRIDLQSLAINGVAQVGMVPKYLAVTPNDKYILVSNWCSYDLSVLDYKNFNEVKRIRLGAYPRGIAIDKSSNVAYVAVMGSFDVAKIDLNTFAVQMFAVGNSPRHLVLSPDGTRLFVTLNGDNRVAEVNTGNLQVIARVTTGSQPRSMAISSDGQALYVVNYQSNTVSILRSSDMSIARTFPVPDHPIGIAYEPTEHRVWVACYSGEILVYNA